MSLSSQILRGAAILTVSRVITRLFSLVAILTVARWLGPEEMGVFGVATLMLTALEQLSETGLRPAVIQRQGDISRYITPVRTVQAARGLFLGSLVFVTAPWVAGFFSSPKSLEILRVIALVPVIQGLEPIFETLARKELSFCPIVKVQVVSGLVGLLVGVISAYMNPDAWALVYSTLSRVAISTLGYYWVSERKLWTPELLT
jgi:O-antigen/teichoic acid export membrane protein